MPETVSYEYLEGVFFGDTYTEENMSTLDFVLYELKQLEDADMVYSQSYCMMLWTGIDLMSRFYSGQLLNQKSFKRIKSFLFEFFPIPKERLRAFIQFRNSCIHSVGYYAYDDLTKSESRFYLSSIFDQVIEKDEFGKKLVNPIEFKKGFVQAVSSYRDALKKDPELQAKFVKVYRKLGYINYEK
ncbi:MAG: hypothetical protein KDC83_13890 [Flavobacteriales bacterium]|nr:hypothetical protein [Flavobacteriales bacterium]